MTWITENADEFLSATHRGYEREGRGAVAVDATKQPVKGQGNPMIYLPQIVVEELDDEDLKRMVRQYDPESEFVALLLKGDHDSKYRIELRRRK